MIMDFNHINILPATDYNQEQESGPVEFIPRPSLQNQIANELAYSRRVGSGPANPLSPRSSHPATFAEAAMSIPISRSPSESAPKQQEHEDSPSKALQNLGPLKIVKKKKKVQKWAALDLNTVEDAIDTTSNYSEAATPRILTPTLTNSVLHPTEFDDPVQQPFTALPESSSRNKEGSGSRDPPSTNPASSIVIEAITHSSSAEDSKIAKDSFEQGKDNEFATIMAHLNQYVAPKSASSAEDLFDSLTWDPDLPQAIPADKSPEKITTTEKPRIAYTTVGSVVNPNIIPQFSAPHRIQREGAGRRPLMSMSNRQYDSLLQPRGPPGALSMSNSMQYTQNIQPIPSYEPLYKSRPSPVSSLSSLPQLTEQEKQVLGKLDEAIAKIPLNIRRPAAEMRGSQLSSSGSSVGIVINEDEVKRSFGATGLKQGLEKMQTLQRLARFENPMRQHALSRLSQFSVAANAGKSTENAGAAEVSQQSSSQGELDQGFQLPQDYASKQSNPLFSSQLVPGGSTAPNRPPGYPQPLTAGPPGQRQVNQAFLAAKLANSGFGASSMFSTVSATTRPSSGFSSYPDSEYTQNYFNSYDPETFLRHNSGSGTSAFDEIYNSERRLSYLDQVGMVSSEQSSHFHGILPVNEKQSRPQDIDTRMVFGAVAPMDRGPWSVIRETLTESEMSRYYPNGLPHLGIFSALSVGMQKQMDDVAARTKSKVTRAALKKTSTEDFFYHGQRRYNMTTEDHIIDLEIRSTGNSHGSIGRSRKNTTEEISTSSIITPETVDSMPLAEAIQPAIHGLFGTILAYAEIGPTSRKKMSGWVQSSSEYIDDSVEGNQSVFGEDWGRIVR